MMKSLDDEIGKVLKALTIQGSQAHPVIFTSDTAASDSLNGLFRAEVRAARGGIRVPAIAAGPA